MILKKLGYATLLFTSLTACSVSQPNLPAHDPKQMITVNAEQNQQTRPIIALVLGSGGARGYAHIGVLQALEQQGIKPDFIVGASAGSLVGVLYSSTQSSQTLYEIAEQLKVNDIREFDIGMQSVFDGDKIATFVNKHIQQQKLEDLKIPVYVVATRLDNGEQTVFNYGDAGKAVQASISIPTMFAPVKIGQNEYVDGGLVSPVPVKIAKDLGADMVIAVNILAQPHYTNTDNMWGLFNQNINIMQYHLAKQELSHADIVIQPDIKDKKHVFDIKARNEIVQAGQQATQAKITDIEQRIQQLKVIHQQK